MTYFPRLAALVLGFGLGFGPGVGAGVGAAQTAALPPLEEDATVLGGFYAIGLADEVRKNCPSIEPRIIRALTYLETLKSYARNQGYTNDDIRALQDNKAAKEALKARILRDLAARGATPGATEGYCDVGREEIAMDSAAGRLLRVK